MSSAAQEPFKVKIEESAAPLDGKNIAEELSKLADDYLIGTGDVLRNSQRALEFYEQAARMGDSYACVKAAELLGQVGGGVKPNAAKALDYLKRALSLDPEGLWYLNGEIAKFYSKANQAVSALPYWRKFAERLDKNANTSIAVMLWRYCFDVVHCGIPHEIPDSTIGLFGPLLISEVKNEATMNRISVYWAEKTQNFIVDCVGKSW
jgi:tetratricopeptide (TPR) repeat protein